MYKGKRDDHLTIRVPQRLCYLYESKSGEEFVEIRLPNGNDDTWYSFMVKPAQVFYDYEEPDFFNVIEGLNRDTKIRISRKIKTDKPPYHAIVPDSEIEYNPSIIKQWYE